jgi:hypothetical protein
MGRQRGLACVLGRRLGTARLGVSEGGV